jgi:hypothetical protein
VLFVSWRERDVLLKAALSALPAVVRDDLEGFRQLQRQPFVLGPLSNAAFCAPANNLQRLEALPGVTPEDRAAAQQEAISIVILLDAGEEPAA